MQIEEEHKCSGLQPEGQMEEANSMCSAREQGNAAKLHRGGNSLFFSPLSSPKNIMMNSVEMAGRMIQLMYRVTLFQIQWPVWQIWSLACMLVLLPDKLLLIPQDPAQMSPPLGGPPRLTQVEPMTPLLCPQALHPYSPRTYCHAAI